MPELFTNARITDRYVKILWVFFSLLVKLQNNTPTNIRSEKTIPACALGLFFLSCVLINGRHN